MMIWWYLMYIRVLHDVIYTYTCMVVYILSTVYICVLPFVFLSLKHVWRQNGCWQRSLNVTEDRITLVDIRYDGKKWLEGPNGRRLAMVVWETQSRRHMASLVTSGWTPWHAFGSCFLFPRENRIWIKHERSRKQEYQTCMKTWRHEAWRCHSETVMISVCHASWILAGYIGDQIRGGWGATERIWMVDSRLKLHNDLNTQDNECVSWFIVSWRVLY